MRKTRNFKDHGDFNGNVGKATEGFDGAHGGHWFGSRKSDGIGILDLCAAANQAFTNIYLWSQTVTKSFIEPVIYALKLIISWREEVIWSKFIMWNW